MLHGIGSVKSVTVEVADALAAGSNKQLNFG